MEVLGGYNVIPTIELSRKQSKVKRTATSWGSFIADVTPPCSWRKDVRVASQRPSAGKYFNHQTPF